MLKQFSRTQSLIGKQALEKLANCKVAIYGIGGVGSFTVEALARSGIGNFILIDKDDICITNINRQIHATLQTVGLPKVQVMKQRILSINPNAHIDSIKDFYLEQNAAELLARDADYIVDAIDTITSKIALVVQATNHKIQIISAMGAGNKLDPTKFEVADIYKTSVDPIAKIMRKKLRELNINKLKVVYSKELPITLAEPILNDNNRHSPASISFVPSVAGLIIASEVIKDLLQE